jgi:hypothetical protein
MNTLILGRWALKLEDPLPGEARLEGVCLTPQGAPGVKMRFAEGRRALIVARMTGRFGCPRVEFGRRFRERLSPEQHGLFAALVDSGLVANADSPRWSENRPTQSLGQLIQRKPPTQQRNES